ncbi:hypothetical protein [Bacillus sp. V2I10]|uniref:hypothetical protein n=1 Tax=Bacillus sp. V2I10 TaxID=3042276 RepID=UPI002786D864|nr:hypothetical protein [Bacillus sp. V2I10]MDQ0858921.1 hypothetical protein [Bacillus sp. V2I10]
MKNSKWNKAFFDKLGILIFLYRELLVTRKLLSEIQFYIDMILSALSNNKDCALFAFNSRLHCKVSQLMLTDLNTKLCFEIKNR